MRPHLAILLLALAACGRDGSTSEEWTPAEGGLPFRFVDVAAELGYTLRNHTGKANDKEYILEAMPPGIAIADFNNDGWMDMYCANGNDIQTFDRTTKEVTLLPREGGPRNELYWNREGRRFEPGGAAAGVDDELWSYGTAAGDLDNDGDADIYLCNWGLNRLFLNRGDGTFEEAAQRLGVAGRPEDWSTGCCFFDYDRDGDLDIYVCQFSDIHGVLDNPQITRYLPGNRVSGRTCTWKGLKVYCGPTGIRPLNDFLFKNLLAETGSLAFQDVSKEAGIELPYDDKSDTDASRGPYYGFQPVAWDIDGDGWMDVYVANDSVANTCWINQKDGTFVDRAQEMGLAISMDDFTPQASMGIGVADMDEDGLQDILIAHFSHDTFNMLRAERLPNGLTVFGERASRTGYRDITFRKLGWGTILLDPDRDGDLDIFHACGHVYPEVDSFPAQETTYRQTNLLILNEDPKRMRIRDVSAEAGPAFRVEKVSRAAVAYDFDNDGDMDIPIVNLNDDPSFFRCDVAPEAAARHWLQIRLRGDPARKIPLDPSGAEITVTVKGRNITRVFLIGSSFMSSEDPRIPFGLGDSPAADEVSVRWPNGRVTQHGRVEGDRVVTITYPADG